MPHLLFLLLSAVMLSLAMAMLEARPSRQRLYAGLRAFLCYTMTVLAGSWLMLRIHG